MTNKIDQKQKFIDAARAHGASDDPAEFDRAIGKIAKAPPTDAVQDRKKQKKPEKKKPAK